ncbi:MAG: NUDIX hydrolase [Tissierella sp.]|uniref:NUDIX hydrolase n=1 Tax=Tissierella sp. TaxID=41274 RepID=UPI003F969EB6
MVKINYYELGSVDNSKLKFAIVMAKYMDKWIFVRHKERSTWEMPAGHREKGENINCTASRELIEETGAIDFDIFPVSIYSVINDGIESFGQLFYSHVKSIGKLPDYEIEEIKLFYNLPRNITYPLVQTQLFKKIEKFYMSLY